MAMGRLGRRVGAVLGAILVAGACGGSDGGDDGASVADLVGRLPEDAREVAVLDVAAFRRDLGLPDDQGIAEFDDSTRSLVFAMGTALPFLANPQETPIRQELDTGAVSAVASVPVAFARDQTVAVVRTSQSFDDLAAGLENHGYERDGDLVVTGGPVLQAGVTAVAPAGDGVIVLALSPDVARAAASGQSDGPALAGVLDTMEGPLRVAFATADDGEDSGSCLETVAAGWQAEPLEGELAVTVADQDDADGDALFPDDESRIVRNLDLDQPRVDGRTVRVRYRYDDPGSPFSLFSSELPAGDLYRCP